MAFVGNDDNTKYISFPSSTHDFAYNTDWVMAVFVYFTQSSADDNFVINITGSSNKYYWRLDMGSAPQNMEVRNNSTRIGTTNEVCQLNTWYLWVLSCDSASGLIYNSIYSLAGSEIGGGNSFTAYDIGAVSSFYAGADGSTSEPLQGKLAHLVVLDATTWDAQDAKDFLRNPARKAASYGASTKLYAPMIHPSNLGVDLSGRGNNGTVNGSPSCGDNPRLQALWSYETLGVVAGAAAAAAERITQFMKPLQVRAPVHQLRI